MRDPWSSDASKDLHLGWDGAGGSTGLAEALRTAIRDGRLAMGDALPSTRALAADLGVARGTVSKAYQQLAAEGHLRTRQGTATTVATGAVTAPAAPRSNPAHPVAESAVSWNFLPGLPDLSLFPRARWLSATRRVLSHAPAQTFGYGDPAGEPALRTALARYLGRTRGVLATPDRIVICAGYGQGISVLAKVLLERGASEMAFEDPSLRVFRDFAERAGQHVVGVGVDEHGISVSDVDSPTVVVTPAHQWPLGVTLSPDRRARLARWAHRSGSLVIEDDYDGEFRFDRQPVGALQALAPERVIYAGTASKTLAPGLRLGWLVLPETLVRPVRAALAEAGARGRALEQLVLAELLNNGEYDKHVRRCRNTYRSRRDRLLRALPDSLWPAGIAAGLHMVLMLPEDGPDERAVRASARRRSVAVDTLGPHWMGTVEPKQGIIIGYAAPAEHAFAPAVKALLAAVKG